MFIIIALVKQNKKKPDIPKSQTPKDFPVFTSESLLWIVCLFMHKPKWLEKPLREYKLHKTRIALIQLRL